MDLLDLNGIGPKKKEYLNRLSINSISDLYNYYPREYEDRSHKMLLNKSKENVKYFFEFTIASKLYFKKSRKFVLSYLYACDDNQDQVKIIWFNDKFSPRKLIEGKKYKFFTKVKKIEGIYECINPIFSELNDENIGGIVPIYGLTKSITNKQISSYIKESLRYYDKDEEILSPELLDRFKINSRYKNLLKIHFPEQIESLKEAKSQIKILDFIRELLFLQVLKTQKYKSQDLSLKYNLDFILSKIPFELTRSQRQVLVEIIDSSNQKKPMNRLLCGDVGSGKTIVAIILMIIFAQNKYQSAMMVPTEVLAIQQYENNIDLINSFGLKVSLLTGSSKNKEEIKKKLESGEIDIVIGTHALIQEDVSFKNLKLIINDEQHRFGVIQRQRLAEKGENPNYLTMTATPIPRTLYLKISDLLDISIIDQLPKSRIPIKTEIVTEAMEESLFSIIKDNLIEKRQVYVVSNNIDSDDSNSVNSLYERYKKKFRKFKVETLHGRLNSYEKEKILKDFNDGKIDILISTTVIEVGIDVKNANIMVIYNATKFGLSTLHQLRGRVGRGEYKSYCYLISKNQNENKKLSILARSNNGFEIAKLDLDIRGGGKILSTIQHGKNLEDVEYLNMSKSDIDKSFEIFNNLKKCDFKGVNFNYIKNYFNLKKRIILN